MHSNDFNITLIGMPFSGKTTIAKEYCKKFNFNFIDLDTVIEEKFNMKLSDIVLKFGNKEFKKIEENTMLEMSGKLNVFSTGGSVIYSEIGMKHLQKISKVIFLNVDVNELKNRMNNTKMEDRAIVFENGQTFDTLFIERYPLYNKFATKVIDCNKLSIKEIVDKINI